jgi:sigma-E factor negative regulatory protein RseA
MANSVDEQISALMDGELSEREVPWVLERMRKDHGLAARWRRYHLIRDALHDTLPERIHFDLSGRIREALRDEPTVLVPQRKLHRHLGPVAKQAAGMAIAASVAAIAILTFQSVYDESPTTVAANTPAPAVERMETEMRRDPRLDAYLVNHNEHSVSTGMQGMLPYVRIVSQGAEGEAAP